MHLLIAHLLDTAAVGELIWDRYLAPTVRRQLDDSSGGRGRTLLSLLCGLHDIGKATPAFQQKDDALARRVKDAGFTWGRFTYTGWHHTYAGAKIVKSSLTAAGWSPRTVDWIWPIIAGHHGCVPATVEAKLKDSRAHGSGVWQDAQQAFVDRVIDELDADLRDLADIGVPSRATQLAVSGLVVMADWIASDDQRFGGVADVEKVSMAGARGRALKSWTELDLRGGWAPESLAPAADQIVRSRFGFDPNPAQRDVIAMVESLTAPRASRHRGSDGGGEDGSCIGCCGSTGATVRGGRHLRRHADAGDLRSDAHAGPEVACDDRW